MKSSLTKIGNSKGLIIPAKILRDCGFSDEADIEVKGNSLIVTPIRKIREGWEKSFEGAENDELLLPDHMSSEWDEEEWVW